MAPHMSERARKYESGAVGYRVGEAPSLRYVNPNPGKNRVRFDGIEGTTLIDRKLSLYSSTKGKYALQRQFEAVMQNSGFTVRIEVPTDAVKNRMEKVMRDLRIDPKKMSVWVVPE